jgi:hypothetical protein
MEEETSPHILCRCEALASIMHAHLLLLLCSPSCCVSNIEMLTNMQSNTASYLLLIIIFYWSIGNMFRRSDSPSLLHRQLLLDDTVPLGSHAPV